MGSVAPNYADYVSGKTVLQTWVVEALRDLGGAGTPAEVARLVWEQHEDDLRRSGNLFFTWQYDLRWAAQKLRDSGALRSVDGDRRSLWELERGYDALVQKVSSAATGRMSDVYPQPQVGARKVDGSTALESATYILESLREQTLGKLFGQVPPQLSLEVIASDTRIRNALKRDGLVTFGQLVDHSVADLFLFRNVGESSILRLLADLVAANRSESGAEDFFHGGSLGTPPVNNMPWLNEAATDLETVAQWRSVLGQPNSSLLHHAHSPDEPASVSAARRRLNALTAISVLGKNRPTAVDSIDSLLVGIDDRSLCVLRDRVFADKPQTLDALGEQFGVTRERMRQLETKARTLLQAHLDSSMLGGLMKTVRARVDGVSTLESLLHEMPSLRANVPTLNQPVWRVFDRLDKSYEIDRGWCAEPSLSSAIEATRDAISRFDTASLPTLPQVAAALENVNLPAERLADWLIECGYATWSSHVLVHGDGIRERARAILQTAGEPLPATEIHSQLGVDRSLTAVKNALAAGAPHLFMRVDRGEVYGLSEWGLHQYTTIRELIRDHVSQGNGQVALSTLVDTITSRFSVAATSVVAYASSYPFELQSGMVTLATSKSLTERSPWQTRRLYRGSGEWLLRSELTQDHARGAGSLIPATLAAAIGVEQGGTLELSSRLGPQAVTAKGLQPSLGSVRRFVETDGLELAQEVIFSFSDTGVFDVRSLQEVGGTMVDAALALIGSVGATSAASPLVTLATAIGTSVDNGIAGIIQAYRDRGDDDIAELLELL